MDGPVSSSQSACVSNLYLQHAGYPDFDSHLRKGTNLAFSLIFAMWRVLKQIKPRGGSKTAHLSLFVI
jgi:hypothetical protein